MSDMESSIGGLLCLWRDYFEPLYGDTTIVCWMCRVDNFLIYKSLDTRTTPEEISLPFDEDNKVKGLQTNLGVKPWKR